MVTLSQLVTVPVTMRVTESPGFSVTVGGPVTHMTLPSVMTPPWLAEVAEKFEGRVSVTRSELTAVSPELPRVISHTTVSPELASTVSASELPVVSSWPFLSTVRLGPLAAVGLSGGSCSSTLLQTAATDSGWAALVSEFPGPESGADDARE